MSIPTSESEVTVAIPTYNRSALLRLSLKSALTQDYPNFGVLVIDNASTDDTELVVQSFADPRVTYVRNETNIGLFRNWNKAIALNSSPYLTILQDDDELLTAFIRESVNALDANPSAAFSFAQSKCVGVDGVPIHDLDSRHVSDSIPEGMIKGLDYLHQIVAGRKWIIRFSTVMMRAKALQAAGPFDTPHAKRSIDLNLYLRLAARYDMVSIRQALVQVRFHVEQDSQSDYNVSGGTGPIATMAERTDAVAYLLQSVRADDSGYRRWLAERLLHVSMCRSELTAELLPGFNLGWSERAEILTREIAALIPHGKRFILVDEAAFEPWLFAGWQADPFVGHNGQYWGPPADDDVAICELKKLRQSGAQYFVIAWPAFWWLDYYADFRDYLFSTYYCVRRNSRFIAFDLAKPMQDMQRSDMRR